MTAGPIISFRVFGVPQPGGSKRGFVNPRTGRVVIVEDARRNKSWRESVLQAAVPVAPKEPLRGALFLEVTFLMPRPKGHFRTGKRAHILREAAPLYHTSKPDATKLLRATEDALTGILWHDDAQIAMQIVKKRYTSSNPGAEIKILPWIEGAASNVDLSPQDLFA